MRIPAMMPINLKYKIPPYIFKTGFSESFHLVLRNLFGEGQDDMRK